MNVTVDLLGACTLASELSASGPSSFYAHNYVSSYGLWPVKMAFDSTTSVVDSVKFWTLADSLNRAFCAPLIIPAMKIEVVQQMLSTGGYTDGDGIIVRLLPPHGSPSGGSSGGANLTLATIGLFQLSGLAPADFVPDSTYAPVVWHETLHAFGFGHSDQPSIMNPNAVRGISIQRKDVAFVLFMQWSREAERINNSRFSVPQLYQGWRKDHGLPEESVTYLDEMHNMRSTVSNPGGPMIAIPKL